MEFKSNAWFLYDIQHWTDMCQRRTLRSVTISGNEKSLKNDEKCFLFHLKSSLCS